MVLALIAGACLGAAGLVLQEALRNPLAVPEMLGVSSGAALGVAAPLVLALTVPLGLQPFLALAGAALGGLLTLVAAGFGRSPSAVLLTGAAVAAALQAALLVLMVMADQLDLQLIYRYLLGSLSARTWDDVTGLLPWLAVAVPALVLCVPALGVLRLGDDDARALGVRVERARVAALGIAVVLIAPRRRGLRTGGLGRLPRPAPRSAASTRTAARPGGSSGPPCAARSSCSAPTSRPGSRSPRSRRPSAPDRPGGRARRVLLLKRGRRPARDRGPCPCPRRRIRRTPPLSYCGRRNDDLRRHRARTGPPRPPGPARAGRPVGRPGAARRRHRLRRTLRRPGRHPRRRAGRAARVRRRPHRRAHRAPTPVAPRAGGPGRRGLPRSGRTRAPVGPAQPCWPDPRSPA